MVYRLLWDSRFLVLQSVGIKQGSSFLCVKIYVKEGPGSGQLSP